MTSIGVGPGGPIVGAHSFNRDPFGITGGIITCSGKLRSNNILSIDGRFPKRKSASISSRGTLPILPFAHTHLSDVRLCPFEGTVHTKLKKVVIKRLRIPAVRPRGKLPSSLSHGMISNLLIGSLNFRKLIFASTLTVGKMSNGRDVYLRTLGTNGSLLLIPQHVGRRIRTILTTIGGKRLARGRVRTGYHGMLGCGCTLKLRGGPRMRLSNLKAHVGAPGAHSLVHQLGLTTVAILSGQSRMLPLSPSVNRITILGIKRTRRVQPFLGRLSRCAHPIRFRLNGGLPRTSKGHLEGTLTGCGHVLIYIARRHLAPCRGFFTGFTPSMPIICRFFVPNGRMLRVGRKSTTTRTIVLTRSSGRRMRQRITQVICNDTYSRKHLSTDVNDQFTTNTKIALAPRDTPHFMPRRRNVGSHLLTRVSGVTRRNVHRKTCPNYRIIILGSNERVCGGTFNARI